MKTFASFACAALLVAGALTSQSCSSGDTIVRMSGDTVITKSGLRYIDLVEGTGAQPQSGQKITVHYHGTLLDGMVFDSSVERGKPMTFAIDAQQVIEGWDIGLMTMKVGGKRRLIVPPDLAYGDTARNKIPANATLVFDVELLSIASE